MKLISRFTSLEGCLPKMGLDALLFSLAYALAFIARLETIESPYDLTLGLTLPIVVALKIAIFHYTGSYRIIWHYYSLQDLKQLVWATVLSGTAVGTMAFLLPRDLAPPRSVPFLDAAFTLLLVGGSRIVVRVVYESSHRYSANRHLRRVLGSGKPGQAPPRRALLVGAGDTGEAMARQMLRNGDLNYRPVAFVDDEPTMQVHRIHGIPVMGSLEQIPELVRDLDISDVLIAIPSARGKTVQRIVQLCETTSARLKIVPDGFGEGTGSLADLREVQVEDLLGREPLDLNLTLISDYLRGKKVMVTGAGGSIGSELCRQILDFSPSEIHLMGRGENSIYEIHQELSQRQGSTRLVPVIGDVINKTKVEGVVAALRPEIIFHAGADKHVPLMELNPDEAVLNNILGTKNVLEVADKYAVERTVCISSDKAVTPISVMGCCKRIGELLVQSDLYENTIAVAVRFGNVLGSRGSVVPLFQKQIRAGGPITVTDREITRYFMTIPEAVALVIQAGTMGRGGETFVLDMGQPLKIWDLAHNMAHLVGLKPGSDIEIEEIGLRPGEKMAEELTYPDEIKEPTAHRKIICVRGKSVDGTSLLAEIEKLKRCAVQMDFEGIRRGLRGLVPEYQPSPESEERVLAEWGQSTQTPSTSESAKVLRMGAVEGTPRFGSS